MDTKGGKGQSVRWKAWWRHGNIKCAVSEMYTSCWVHQDCHMVDEQKVALKKAAGVSGGKDECQVRLKGREHDYWMGTEIDMLGGYGFQGQVTAGDGSDKQGKMGAGYNNLRRKKKKQQCNHHRLNWISFETLKEFIRNTKRELYDEKLEDALEMLDLEWNKDDETKTQCNRLNTSPLHRGNASNKNGPARVKRRMQWEAPSKPLAVDDPLLLPEREVHAEISINWFLDREIPKGGYVRILAESLLWEERLGKTRIGTTEGLTTCMEPHRGWTIASSS